MQPTSVLLTCAGQRVDMVEAFREALAEEGRGGIAVACDLNPLSPALYAADERALVPPVTDAAYIPTLLELVREHGLRAVLPLTDLDQRILSEQREAFAAARRDRRRRPTRGAATCCADKHEAARFFDAHGIPSPRTWLPDDLPPVDELRFPVLVKSRRGFGSRDIYRCRTRASSSSSSATRRCPRWCRRCAPARSSRSTCCATSTAAASPRSRAR